MRGSGRPGACGVVRALAPDAGPPDMTHTCWNTVPISVPSAALVVGVAAPARCAAA